MRLPPHPAAVALQFLTRLPLKLSSAPTPQQTGRSLLWYPAVGLLFGGLLQLLALAAGQLPVSLHAALLLAIWVLASGGLHLDGLADSADAWAGGHGDRRRMLAIMKDPRAGPMAVIALLLVLLLKFAALETLLRHDAAPALWLAPYLARSAVLLLFATTPYIRENGLGSALAAHLPRRTALWLCPLLALPALATGRTAAIALLAAIAVFAAVRRELLARIGGTTGDTAGALVELSETAVLLALALAVN